MEKEQFFSEQLEEYRRKFEDGEKTAFHEAVPFALWNNIAVPSWAVADLEEILGLHVNGAFKRKKGVASDAIASRRYRRDKGIHWHVEHLMSLSDQDWRYWAGDVPRGLANAFEAVADLYNQAHRGKKNAKFHTSAMVKAIYYRIEGRRSK